MQTHHGGSENGKEQTMKQITMKQAEDLACQNGELELEMSFCQDDWIKDNSRTIADIECKRIDKTYFGNWPKGWKHQMKEESAERAKHDLLKRFLKRECKELDGAIWLGNWKMIQNLEAKTA
jgi:hypothetical protein